MKKFSLFMLLVLLNCLETSALGSLNLVVNGNFEAGNTGFETGYLYSPTNTWPEGTYTVDSNPYNTHSLFASYGDHTTGYGNMMVVNGAPVSNVTVWEQTVSVSPNTDYEFSLWLSKCTPVLYNRAQLEYFINGTSIGTNYAPETTGEWVEFSQLWQSGLSTTATIRIVDRETAYYGNDFAIDDISFVPEPTTLFLLGLGGLTILRKRRG
jgi:hypothetical protein